MARRPLALVPLCLALGALTACVGAKVQPLDSAEDLVDMSDPPPQLLTASVRGDGGAALGDLEMTDADTWSGNLASGILSVVVNQGGTTQLNFILWEPIEVDGAWPIHMPEEGFQSDATLTYIEDGFGGAAIDGELTITSWRQTNSAWVKLVAGTFEAGPILNDEDPTWVRELRDATFSGVQVTDI